MPHRFGVLLFLALCAGTGIARADSIVVLKSKAPYWQVGQRDNDLSRACALGRFNPSEPSSLIARFTGAEGSAVLTVAKGSGLNLRDPDHHAKPTEDYFFRNEGTTSCEVLVGGRGGAVKQPSR